MENQPPAKLIEQALAGDQGAAAELLELQKQGRALRYYPGGRKDATSDGLVAFAVNIVTHDGMTTVRFEAGLSTAIVPLTRDRAIALLRSIHAIVGSRGDFLLPKRASGIKPKFLCGIIYLVMPICASSWDLDYQQALDLESNLMEVLLDQVGGEDLQNLIDEIYGQ